MAKDVVCGMTVDEKRAKNTSEHNGAVYYFCNGQCKETFDSEPEIFLLG